MNAELKDRWVAALRSGAYDQCTSCLWDADNNQYCCLGVLCDIYDPDGWNFDDIERDNEVEYCGEADALSAAVRLGVGLSKNMMRRLINMNDTNCNDFDEIADYIEAAL